MVSVTTYSSFEVEVPCGAWYAGEKYLCNECERKARQAFPQGWRYTPGDVCPHGHYIGGCGPDYICGRCEGGRLQHVSLSPDELAVVRAAIESYAHHTTKQITQLCIKFGEQAMTDRQKHRLELLQLVMRRLDTQ
jgi:hypothetical protein